MSEVHNDESPQGQSRDTSLASYLLRQRHLAEQSALIEEELSERVNLIRHHHSVYTGVASKFVSLLSNAAENTFLSLERVASPTPAKPPSAERRLSQSASRSSPSRMLLFPATASTLKPARTIELSGRPQVHRKRVAERRVANEVLKQQSRVHHLMDQMARHTDSAVRHGINVLSKSVDTDRMCRAIDAKKVVIDRERQGRHLRDFVRTKHDGIAAKQKRLVFERQAAASAVRRLDHMADLSIHDLDKRMQHELYKCAAETLKCVESNESRCGDISKAVHNAHANRRVTSIGLQQAFESQLTQFHSTLRKLEHEAAIDYAKGLENISGVEVSWPEGILKRPERSYPHPINETIYQRLCGAPHSAMTHGASRVGHVDPSALRSIAPSHWAALRATAPEDDWDAVETLQSAIVRGPPQVRWR